MSVEKSEHTNPKSYALPDEPIANLAKVRQSPRGPRGQYGLGKNGQEFCRVSIQDPAILIANRSRMFSSAVRRVKELEWKLNRITEDADWVMELLNEPVDQAVGLASGALRKCF